MFSLHTIPFGYLRKKNVVVELRINFTSISLMASELIIERFKSNKNKDKASIMGYIYTLNRVSDDLSFWVCEKRGTCKARVHTRNDIIVKPVIAYIVSEIQQAHTHTPSQVRVQMLKDYRKMKDIASNSEQSTRGILSIGIGEMNSSTINKLPQLESVKRTIRNYKSLSIENCGSPTCAAEIVIPEKYKTSLKGEPFLLYDSGFGDEQRIIIYGTLKFLSLLRNCDGTLVLFLICLHNFILSMQKRME